MTSPSPEPPVPSAPASPAVALGCETVVGTVLETYRILRPLGAGGMGRVYQVQQTRTGRLYALKLLHPDKQSKAQAVARFEREALLLARLNHENIVELHDLHLHATRPFLVMEYIEGRTLRDELNQHGVRPVSFVLELLKQVCRGLDEAHRLGIIHRDLKPENIMLTEHADGRLLLKILDFGVARLYQEASPSITNTEVGIGTAAYMSPEQARGERELDVRSDVHALGVIAYEMLTGKPPFVGACYNEILFQVANRAHKPLSMRRPDLSLDLIELVEGALAKERADRCASVAEMLEQLNAQTQGGTNRGSHYTPNLRISPSVALEEDILRPDWNAHLAPALKASQEAQSRPRGDAPSAEVLATDTESDADLQVGVEKAASSEPTVGWKVPKVYAAAGLCLAFGVSLGYSLRSQPGTRIPSSANVHTNASPETARTSAPHPKDPLRGGVDALSATVTRRQSSSQEPLMEGPRNLTQPEVGPPGIVPNSHGVPSRPSEPSAFLRSEQSRSLPSPPTQPQTMPRRSLQDQSVQPTFRTAPPPGASGGGDATGTTPSDEGSATDVQPDPRPTLDGVPDGSARDHSEGGYIRENPYRASDQQ